VSPVTAPGGTATSDGSSLRRTASGASRAAELAARVRALLVHEELDPGERLGDERSLAAQLGVPRAALRSALEVLERAGVVRRTIGRGGGVHLSDGRLERNLNTRESLPDIARRQGVRVSTQVLHVALTTAGPRERRLLQLPEGAPVHTVTRLRLAGGRPLSLESAHLPADLFPGLGTQDLSSLYRTLRVVYAVTPVVSDESLQVDVADDGQARLLAVAPGTALLHVRRTATGSGGRPIEAAHELFVADRVRFHLRAYGAVRDTHHTPEP